MVNIIKPFFKLWNKKAISAYGTRPNSERLKIYYDQFGKNVLERVNLRKAAAASESNIQFVNRLTGLEKITKSKRWGGKDVAIKYDDDTVNTWVKLNEGKQGATNRDFIVKQLGGKNLIQSLDRRSKQLFPNFKTDPYHKTIYSASEAKDKAFVMGLENLSDYAWKYKTTGRELSGQDLKNVMWPKNPELHNLWKGDSFSGMVNEGIRKQHNNLFPDHFNQYSSITSPKKSLQEQQIPLQNKEFMKILNYKGKIPRSGVFDFVDDINIMGPKNARTVSDIVGTAHNASKKMKDLHPSVSYVLKHNIHNLINRTFMSGFKSGDKDVTIDKMMKFVDKMKNPEWANAYVDLVNKRLYYEDFFKLAEKMGGVREVPNINLKGFDNKLVISHKKALKNYYELGTDIDNLFLQGSTKNLKQGAKTVSVGQVRDELKLLTDMMEDNYYQVMGLNRGGIVNGYQLGGIVKGGLKKLLGSSLFNASRRKFLKQAGATAAYAAMPKAALKLAAPAAKKAALSYAPPWVSSMLSALKSVPVEQSFMRSFIVGNDANIMKMGSKKIKLYKDQTATETYFRIKTSDSKLADDAAKAKGESYPYSWDDIILTEEKGQTTITWKNKDFDAGNDQHIIIDKINKETKFVDDNWHMEAGGEDIAKDDWIEYAITPNKNEIALSLKKPFNTIDDATVDGYSVADMDNYYADTFRSYVDSFSPSGNIFGSVQRMQKLIRKKDALRLEKIRNDIEVRDIKEKEMMDWEEQFRGGQGIHGYKYGGNVFRGGPPSVSSMGYRVDKANEIRPRPKPKPESRSGMRENLLSAIAQQETGGVDKTLRDIYVSPSGNVGRYGLSLKNFSKGLPLEGGRIDKAHAATGYGVHRWANMANEWKNRPDLQKQYAGDFIMGMYDHFTRKPQEMLFGNYENPHDERDRALYEALIRYGPTKVGEDTTVRELGHPKNYYDMVMQYYSGYNKGGLVKEKKFTVDDAVAAINANPQSFQGGGIVKLFAPKIIGKLTQYATRARPTAKVPPLKKPWAVFDREGSQVKEFRTKKEADSWFKKASEESPTGRYASVDKIPWSTSKLAKGTKYGDPDKPGAIFWGSREKIIGSPQESMTGQGWLDYLLGKGPQKGFPIIKHAELNDTSLAPFLSKYKNKVIPKKTLVDSFDRIAPKMDVEVAGREVKTEMMDKYLKALTKIDPQSYREPQAGFFRYLKSTEDQLKRGMQPDAIAKHKEEAESVLQNVNKIVDDIYGVPNVLEKGFPQRFPFELKNMINQLSSASGKRITGLREYAGKPQYATTQTLGGGENPRELLFRYTPGALRKGEPVYKYQHGFSGIPEDKGKNAFVHMRMTDRTDEYGRRILFIEEIQSDMHQPVRQAQKVLKNVMERGRGVADPDYKTILKNSRYAQRGDVPVPVNVSDKVNEDQFRLIISKIEDLAAQPQTVATQKRITKLNKERDKIRKIIDASKKKAVTETSGVPQGPYSRTEDYNEFVIKYATKMAQEGGYDGVSIASPAIKNRGLRTTDESFGGNLVAYGPMATGAMRKVAKKSGAKFVKTSIMDDNGVAWEVPMIWLDDQAKFIVSKGLPAYKRGGIAING